jgi:hypothetical protein
MADCPEQGSWMSIIDQHSVGQPSQSLRRSFYTWVAATSCHQKRRNRATRVTVGSKPTASQSSQRPYQVRANSAIPGRIFVYRHWCTIGYLPHTLTPAVALIKLLQHSKAPMSGRSLWVRPDKGHPDATVAKILITGTVAGYPAVSPDANGNGPAVYFHWQPYFQLRGFPKQSVVSDVTPRGSYGNTGVLMVTTQKILRATGEDRNVLTREVAILGSGRVTIQGIIDLLTSKGLTRYRFNAGGMGCRWWCEVVMQMLKDGGHVESGTVSVL